MALSGSYSYTVPNTRNYLALTVSWTATQNVAANTSTVRATLVLNRRSYGAIYSSNAKDWTISINGTKTNGRTAIAGGNNSNTTLGSATTTVPHNADGSKSFSISFNLNFGGVSWLSTGATLGLVGSGNTFTLNTIPRASSFASVGNTLLNATVPINISSRSSSFTHKVDAKIGTTTIQGWENIKGGAQTFTFSSAANTAIAKQLTQSTSVQINWALSTWSGTTQIGGYAGATSTISLPASELTPTVGTVTAKEANANALKLLKGNSFVQGISKLVLSVSGSSATHGATIKSTTISFEGKNYSSGDTTSVIVGSGTINAMATVTDSRGQQASETLAITVTAYQAPQITTAIAMRTNASGSFVSDGTYCTVSYSVTASALPMLSGGNYPTISLDMQAQGASGWTKVKSIPYTAATATATQVLGSGYDGAKAYNIRITATDKVGGTNQVVITLDVAHVLMSWGKTQVGIGKVATQGTLDVLGDTYLEGGLHVSGAATLGATTMSSASVSGTVAAGGVTVGGVALTTDELTRMANYGKQVWSGTFYPQVGDKANPTIPLSKTNNGWLIRWNNYTSSKLNNKNYNYTLIPNVPMPPGSNDIVFPISMPNIGTLFKQVYYNDSVIEGVAGNRQGSQAPNVVMDAIFAV